MSTSAMLEDPVGARSSDWPTFSSGRTGVAASWSTGSTGFDLRFSLLELISFFHSDFFSWSA